MRLFIDLSPHKLNLVSNLEMNSEALAPALYSAYCAAVGGVAFNGDPLPDWQTFRADPAKLKQSEAWMAAAAVAERSINKERFVPGIWMCRTCNFTMHKRIIGKKDIASDTGIHVEPCPNDGDVMFPVSWKEYSEGAELFAEQKMEELRKLATGSVVQAWVHHLPRMQQSVILAAIRGPDGQPKYGPSKNLLRWYRRCTLLSALDGKVLDTPFEDGGGSFTGPSFLMYPFNGPIEWEAGMELVVDAYLRDLDAIPHHFQIHFLHAIEIVGYKHPSGRIAEWWRNLYLRLVQEMHLHPESLVELDLRLGDSREGWLERADAATSH